MNHGPAVTKVILKYASVLAIPKGGGIADGLKFFMDEQFRKTILAQAENDIMTRINYAMTLPGNPYKNEEDMAQAILDEVERRKHGQVRKHH